MVNNIFENIKSLFKKQPSDIKNIYKDRKNLNKKVDNKQDMDNINIDNKDNNINNEKNFYAKTIKDWETEVSGDFDWFADRYQSLVVQRNITLFLLIISILCLGGIGVALAVITNSKTIEPFVIEIDKRSGIVTYVNNTDKTQEYAQNEILRNYFIKKYLDARETFDPKNSDYFYNKVIRSLSDQNVYYQFTSLLRSGSPDSPNVMYANAASMKVNIISISEIKPKTLQVRFTVDTKFNDGSQRKTNRIVILQYDFFNIEMNEEKYYINPLGFIVLDYKATNENY